MGPQNQTGPSLQIQPGVLAQVKLEAWCVSTVSGVCLVCVQCVCPGLCLVCVSGLCLMCGLGLGLVCVLVSVAVGKQQQ